MCRLSLLLMTTNLVVKQFEFSMTSVNITEILEMKRVLSGPLQQSSSCWLRKRPSKQQKCVFLSHAIESKLRFRLNQHEEQTSSSCRKRGLKRRPYTTVLR